MVSNDDKDLDDKFLILKKNNCDTDFFSGPDGQLTKLINYYEKLVNEKNSDNNIKSKNEEILERLIRFRNNSDTTNVYRTNKMNITMIHDMDTYNLIGLDEFFKVSRHNLSFVSFNFSKVYPLDDLNKIEDELAIYWREDFPFDFYLRENTLDKIGENSVGNVEIEGEVEYIELSQNAEDFHINTSMRVTGFIK